MAKESHFRGYWSIAELMLEVDALQVWMKQHKPHCTTITLKRKDHDLLCRWPKAAALFDITVHGAVIMRQGFVLRPDSGPGRYEQQTPENAEIV